MNEYGCVGCMYFKGVIWLGDNRYVDCAHPADSGHKTIHPSRGCGLRIAKSDEGGCHALQKSLFD